MSRLHEHYAPSHDRSFYPPSTRRRIEDPVDPETAASRERIAFQKRYDWEVRQRMLVQEILAASDATPEEIAFLTGQTDVDPNPNHEITYKELVDSGETLVISENVTPNQRITPKIRLAKDKAPDGLTWREKLAYGLSSRPLTGDRLGSFERQIRLKSEVEFAMPRAQIASNLSWSEWEAIEGIKDRDGIPLRDPHPDHLPVYNRLVARPEPDPASQETSIFES